MVIKSVRDVTADPIEQDGVVGVSMRVMLSESDGAPTFNLRVFDVEPGGNTPRHVHPYEHELFILEGAGEVLLDGAYHPVKPQDAILVPPNHEHQIRNPHDARLRLICLVPQEHIWNKDEAKVDASFCDR